MSSVVSNVNEENIRDSIKNKFDKCLFIKAGAGAGKSTILVERILNQILAGENPGSIVAITFTNKSAEDLKKKILERLNEVYKELVIRKPDGYERKQAIIESAINNFNQMQVSTIHSFCNVLLSEQMLSSKLRKDVEMLQDNDLENYLYQFYQNNYAKINKNKLKNFYSNYGRNTSVIFTAFKAIAEADDSITIKYRSDLLTNNISYYDDKINGFEENVKQTIVRMYNRVIVDEGINADILSITCIEDLTGEFQLYADLKKDGDKFRKKVSACCTNGTFNSNRKQALKNKYASVDRAIANDLKQECKEVEERILEKKDYQHALIMDVAMELRSLYRLSKDSKYISNDQLLQRAYKLIDENESAWEYYDKKYSRIYVDEFQDTDHVQAELILKLCAEKYNEKELKAGKLVVVGDAKQSIYRFRGADLEEYYGFESIMANQPSTSEILSLKYNFRSSPKIIDWVNNAFKNQSLDGRIPIVNYEEMVPKNNRTEKDGVIKPNNVIEGIYYMNLPGISKPDDEEGKNYIKDKSKSKPPGPNSNQQEVKCLVEFIKKNVGVNYIFDRGSYRKIKYSDFLVLTKNATKIGLYSTALSEAGIPVNVSGKVDITKEYAMNTFARVYNFLARIGRDRNACKTIEYENYGKFNLNGTEIDIVEQLKEKTANLDGISLAYYLLKHLEYSFEKNIVISKNNAVQTMARLTQMVEKVVADNENDKIDLADGFFEYLEKKIERELSLESEQDAVVMMNVHKSKGLQGKIVIICDRKADSDKISTHIHRNNGSLELYPAFDTGGSNSTICGYNTLSDIKDEVAKAMEDEYIRLEYVAATRAEEALVIFPKLANPIKSDSKEYQYNCFMSRYKFSGEDVTMLSLEDYEPNDESQDGSLSVGDESNSSQPVEDNFTEINVKEDVFVASEKLWDDVTPSSKEVHDDLIRHYDHNRPMGNVFGTIMHRMFELIVNNKNSISSDADPLIDKLINKAIAESYADIKDANEVNSIRDFLKDVAKEFVNGEVFTEAKRANEAICEYPFFYFDEKDSNKEWVHGFSDLVLVFDDGIKIVDFKSDSMVISETIQEFEDRLVKSYSPQLKLYKEALTKSFGLSEDKIKTVLYHLYGNHILKVD